MVLLRRSSILKPLMRTHNHVNILTNTLFLSLKWFHSSKTFNYYLLVVCSLQMYNQRRSAGGLSILLIFQQRGLVWYISPLRNIHKFSCLHLFLCLLSLLPHNITLLFWGLTERGFYDSIQQQKKRKEHNKCNNNNNNKP